MAAAADVEMLPRVAGDTLPPPNIADPPPGAVAIAPAVAPGSSGGLAPLAPDVNVSVGERSMRASALAEVTSPEEVPGRELDPDKNRNV